VVYSNYNFESYAHTQSHELRLAGEFANGFIYQVGGFYFKESLFSDSGFYLGSPQQGFFLEYTYRGLISDSWSVFGQAEYPLTDTVTLVGGLRYTDNSREADWRDKRGFFAGPDQRVLDDTNSFRSQFVQGDNKVTWLAGVNYEPDADTLLYAKVATGFKAGGFNNGFDSNGERNAPFAPESNTAYEAGLKKNFGSVAQHVFNLTGFYYDYTDLQVSTIVSTEDGGLTYNAGSATLWGIEADAVFELTENDFLSFTVNYLDAELNELLASYNVICIAGPNCDDITSVPLYPNANTDTPNPGTNYSGNTPAYAPKWIITAGYEHIVDLGNSGSLSFSANTTFKSSYFTTFRNLADEQQEAYTQTDLQMEYTDPSRTWTVAAFVRNLENERPLTQGYYLSAGPDDIYNWQFGSPRLYGLRVGFKF
jgi:iron complex outermembrane receptor protein